MMNNILFYVLIQAFLIPHVGILEFKTRNDEYSGDNSNINLEIIF